MKPFFIAGTPTTPTITLDASKSLFELSGRSVADNPLEVYTPVLQWLTEYAKDPKPSTLFVFKLEFFNTSSAKALLDMLSALSFIKNTKVLWYYQENDVDMKEAAEEFFGLVNIPYEFKTY